MSGLDIVSFPDPFCERARNLKLGAEKGEGKGLANEYHIRPFPSPFSAPNFKFLARAQKGSGNETSLDTQTHTHTHTHTERLP